MEVMVGSARSDENGKLTGGISGDQTGREVMEQLFYIHVKGWYVIRAKSDEHAEKLAERMKVACNNSNIGYDQGNRLAIIGHGTGSKTRIECDCSSLVRQCIIEATGKDPGNFTTSNERSVLNKTGLFDTAKAYTKGMTLYNGDILVTKTRGHSAIVTSAKSRKKANTGSDGGGKYYPKYTGSSTSLVDALKAVGEKETNLAKRERIAKANGIVIYSGSASQNLILLKKLKNGTLIKA